MQRRIVLQLCDRCKTFKIQTLCFLIIEFKSFLSAYVFKPIKINSWISARSNIIVIHSFCITENTLIILYRKEKHQFYQKNMFWKYIFYFLCLKTTSICLILRRVYRNENHYQAGKSIWKINFQNRVQREFFYPLL